MKNKKPLLIAIAFLILIALVFLGSRLGMGKTTQKNTDQKTSGQANKTDPTAKTQQNTFLLDGYPIKDVPLYKLKKVSSNKIFVNTNPKDLSMFDDTNFAYFNVVFESEATQVEFLKYYQDLFEKEVIEEFSNPETVKGTIGRYRVSATHYGSMDTGYVQVHLPTYDDEMINSYFADYPELFTTDPLLTEQEKSFGLLNQKGGELEFTKYFTVADSGDQNKDGTDDVDEFAILEKKYQDLYQNEQKFVINTQHHIFNWEKDGYELIASFSRDHGRVYLMLRKKIAE